MGFIQQKSCEDHSCFWGMLAFFLCPSSINLIFLGVKVNILKDNVSLNLQGIESLIMLPRGTDCPGCDDKDKEYFVSAGSKGKAVIHQFKLPLQGNQYNSKI